MRKRHKGKVISMKMEKTAVILVERVFKHPRYLKTIKKHKKYKARYNEATMPNLGDMVVIEETRPISKEVKFKIIKI